MQSGDSALGMKTVCSFSFFFLCGLANSSYVSTAVDLTIICFYSRDYPNQHLAKRVEIVNIYSGTMLTVLLTTMCAINKEVRDV